MDEQGFHARYAEVIVQIGLNVQRGQELYVSAPIEARELVPHVAREAYRRGAKFVHVEYRDQSVLRSRLEEAPEDTLDFVPPGVIGERLRIGRNGDASLAILGEDPMGLAGVDPDRQGKLSKASAEANAELRQLAMSEAYN